VAVPTKAASSIAVAATVSAWFGLETIASTLLVNQMPEPLRWEGAPGLCYT